MKRLPLLLFAAVAATVIAYANPDRFAPGRYVITMVTNSHNKQRYIDPNEGQLWIDIGADSVRLVKTTIMYTPKFGEGESLDLSMEIVSTEEKSVAYKIVDFPERTDDDGTVYHVCRCLTADGVECELVRGIIGHDRDNNDVYAFNFSDPVFADYYWCFVAKDVKLHE